MSKYTPKPWTYTPPGLPGAGKITGHAHPVADVVFGKWGDSIPCLRPADGYNSLERLYELTVDMLPYGEVGCEEAEANMQIITASPDLFEALSEVVLDVRAGKGSLSLERGVFAISRETFHKVEAAIEKASPSRSTSKPQA